MSDEPGSCQMFAGVPSSCLNHSTEHDPLRTALAVLTLSGLVACTQVTPPAQPPHTADRYVHAPFDSVWHRTIVFFADSHVPIANVEKASGLIASSRIVMQFDQLEAWADCGTVSGGGSTLAKFKAMHMAPTAYADFNVVEAIAGDSTSVRVSIVFDATGMVIPTVYTNKSTVTCVSNGQFETALIAHVAPNA